MYEPLIPVESNFVRGVSGDLALMRGNFTDLAPLVSAYVLSGATPSADLAGFNFEHGAASFRLVASGTEFHLMRFSGGAYMHQMRWPQGAGDIEAAQAISGQTPTLPQHLVTKAYADALTLSGLDDVFITGPISGEVLIFSGGSTWRNGRSRVDQLADTSIVSPIDGQALVYSGGIWRNDTVSGGGGSATLSGLTDVALTDPVVGASLLYSGGGVWFDGFPDHGQNLGLSDDDHPQYILADGSRAFTGTVSGVFPTLSAHLATKGYVDQLSGLTVSGAFNLPELLDVDDDVDAAPDGYVLTISGGMWFALPSAGGAGGALDILQVQVFS